MRGGGPQDFWKVGAGGHPSLLRGKTGDPELLGGQLKNPGAGKGRFVFVKMTTEAKGAGRS